MRKVLALCLLLTVCFSGCAREKDRTLDKLTAELPQGMTREACSPQRDSLVVDGRVAGGLLVMELDNAVLFHPGVGGHHKQITDYLKETVLTDVPRDQWDYNVGASALDAHAAICMGTRAGDEYLHYFFRQVAEQASYCAQEDVYYDLWFDCRYVDEETREAIVKSVILPTGND